LQPAVRQDHARARARPRLPGRRAERRAVPPRRRASAVLLAVRQNDARRAAAASGLAPQRQLVLPHARARPELPGLVAPRPRARPAVASSLNSTMHRFTLPFDDAATEALYRASHRPGFKEFALSSAILSSVWVAFSGWAALVIPADSPAIVAGVLGGVVP